MFWGDTRKMRKIKAAARGTARKPMSLLSAAVAAALSTDAAPVPLLGSVPLSVALRTGGDTGVPVVVGDAHDAAARAISAVADALLATGSRRLAGRPLPLTPR